MSDCLENRIDRSSTGLQVRTMGLLGLGVALAFPSISYGANCVPENSEPVTYISDRFPNSESTFSSSLSLASEKKEVEPLMAFYSNLLASQTPLDEDFSEVLYANLSSLYIRTPA